MSWGLLLVVLIGRGNFLGLVFEGTGLNGFGWFEMVTWLGSSGCRWLWLVGRLTSYDGGWYWCKGSRWAGMIGCDLER